MFFARPAAPRIPAGLHHTCARAAVVGAGRGRGAVVWIFFLRKDI